MLNYLTHKECSSYYNSLDSYDESLLVLPEDLDEDKLTDIKLIDVTHYGKVYKPMSSKLFVYPGSCSGLLLFHMLHPIEHLNTYGISFICNTGSDPLKIKKLDCNIHHLDLHDVTEHEWSRYNIYYYYKVPQKINVQYTLNLKGINIPSNCTLVLTKEPFITESLLWE